MKLKFYLKVGVLFVMAGSLLGSQQLISYFNQHMPMVSASSGASITAAPSKAVVIPTAISQPVRLNIPSLQLNIAIEPGYYNMAEKDWTVSQDQASFATITAAPNRSGGNTFIYGHNRSQIFKSLPSIASGAKAQLTTADGQQYEYSYTSRRDTSPSDTSLFGYQGPPIMTLQTCSGLFSQNRTLYSFKLMETK